ncbi:NAD(P)H nitroreductase [Avibacterium sp. 21-586]|uniref:NAD(P)H nitroreductase n=1 Tax=Avibacterium sp. 21-586 TaxID=2911534 RepID=UPI0022478677|nr:NAD(P)H nitroreductase [Avibacterium sp. 21-586]MCW9709768.1 NAD(P)H nitroreductase [Avibacterium sp. 21-586]
MDALTLLTSRRSNKKLFAPAPNEAQLEQIFQAALHVPDHGRLQPYRFVVIEKEGLSKLGNLLKSAAQELTLGEERLKKAENLPNRAPMIIAVIAKIQKDIAKVPVWEQMLSAGCATYAMQLAANAQGFDNIWVTGPWVNGSALRNALQCKEDDKVIALLMVGTGEEKMNREAKTLDISDLVSYL